MFDVPDAFILCDINLWLALGLLFAKHKVLIRGGKKDRMFPRVKRQFRRCHSQMKLVDIVAAAVCHSLVMLLMKYGVDDGRFGVVEIAKDDARRQVLDAT